jgi:catechol 2,3-dioxygenase-like lactoylglutathione lyase family enzyme
MHPEINSILIGVADMARSKKFYAEGLGCPIKNDYPQFISFNLGDGSAELGLYKREALAADAGVSPHGSGFSGVTLHYIVKSSERVDEVLAQAEGAGAKIVKPAQKVQWGYFGWFADPDGHLWKVAAG